MTLPSMLTLHLLGGCSLRCDGETVAGPAAQPRRLALLALAAGFRSTGLSRDKAIAYFWPDDDREHARHYLADSLSTIRKSLGKEMFALTGSEIRLNGRAVTVDLWEFEDAVARADYGEAIRAYIGPFLDGFFVSDAPEFERWVDAERERLRRAHESCVEKLALRFEQSLDFHAVSDLWLELAQHDPYSARVAIRAMLALQKAGDSAGALRHASMYARSIRADLEIEPEDEVIELAQRIRARTLPRPAERSTGIESWDPVAARISLPSGENIPVVEETPHSLYAKPAKRFPFSLAIPFVALLVTSGIYWLAREEIFVDDPLASRVMRFSPPSDHDNAAARLARTLWSDGRYAAAAAIFKVTGNVAEAAVAGGDTTAMRDVLERYTRGEVDIDHCQVAMLYVGLGDRDQAFNELRKSRNIALARMLKEPPLVWLSDDPRYRQLLVDRGSTTWPGRRW